MEKPSNSERAQYGLLHRHPYRLQILKQDKAGHIRRESRLFSSEGDARAFVNSIADAKEVRLHKALNFDTWHQNGQWQILQIWKVDVR